MPETIVEKGHAECSRLDNDSVSYPAHEEVECSPPTVEDAKYTEESSPAVEDAKDIEDSSPAVEGAKDTEGSSPTVEDAKDTEDSSPAVEDAKDTKDSSPDLALQSSRDVFFNGSPELVVLVNKAINLTWKLKAVTKHRSESFYHESDYILYAASFVQESFEDFHSAFLHAKFSKESSLEDDISKLFTDLEGKLKNMIHCTILLDIRGPAALKKTEELAKTVLLEFEKAEKDALLKMEDAEKAALLKLGDVEKATSLKLDDVEKAIELQPDDVDEEKIHIDVVYHMIRWAANFGWNSGARQCELLLLSLDLDRITEQLKISTFQAHCRDTKQKEAERRRTSAKAEDIEGLAQLILEHEASNFGFEKIMRTGKLILQLQSRSVGIEHDDDVKEEQFQLAKLILGLWKSDRLRPIEFGKYFTKGHFETVEVEDTAAHECDMNPGQVDKYLMGLDEEVRERLLKDEDKDTRRSLGFSAKSQACVGVGPNFEDEK
ncbi:hypothetical protein BLS_009985 [Venturia inaequalis]|nr:hypothetical protein EG328_002961 [Venturia inaequalis]KAE9979250.1 hypothetical protein BLS_009985 [Venturia inaequalis]